jgi:hypothetical protein
MKYCEVIVKKKYPSKYQPIKKIVEEYEKKITHSAIKKSI